MIKNNIDNEDNDENVWNDSNEEDIENNFNDDNDNKNKILWMITLTILKMHTMTMIYHQDLMKIIDSKNKSDFLIRASAMVIKRMPTTAK